MELYFRENRHIDFSIFCMELYYAFPFSYNVNIFVTQALEKIVSNGFCASDTWTAMYKQNNELYPYALFHEADFWAMKEWSRAEPLYASALSYVKFPDQWMNTFIRAAVNTSANLPRFPCSVLAQKVASRTAHLDASFALLFENISGNRQAYQQSTRAFNGFRLHDGAISLNDVDLGGVIVQNGCRRTIGVADEASSGHIHFLGMSQITGTDVKDIDTIESYFQALINEGSLTKRRVVNHGICAWLEGGIEIQYLRIINLDLSANDCVFLCLTIPPYFMSGHGIKVSTYIQEMKRHCQDKGALFSFVVLPTIFDVEQRTSYEGEHYQEALRHVKMPEHEIHEYSENCILTLANFGVSVVDTRPCARRPHSLGEVFTDWRHYNHRLNKAIAESIYRSFCFSESRYESKTEIRNRTPQPTPNDFQATAVQYLKYLTKRFYCDNRNLNEWIMTTRKVGFRKEKDCIGAVVLNANPFTLGHLYLIEQALTILDKLYIFVVNENSSYFGFEHRLSMVQSGVAHLGKRICVRPSGNFIISSFTFPEYFSKSNFIGEADPTSDVAIFGALIAPALHIRHRFVGEEPFSMVTQKYNHTMNSILPHMGVEFHVFPRKTDESMQAISATTVRNCITNKQLHKLRCIVPESTYRFIESNQISKC